MGEPYLESRFACNHYYSTEDRSTADDRKVLCVIDDPEDSVLS